MRFWRFLRPVASLCWALVLVLVAPRSLRAQADSAGAGGRSPRSGVAGDALPGVDRVGFAVPLRRQIAIKGELGYGFTEAVIDGSDRHHRAAARVAGAVQALPWLAAGYHLALRLDAHEGGPEQGDSGALLESRAYGRASADLGEHLSLGGQVDLWLPGADGSQGLDSVSLEVAALVTARSAALPLLASLRGGYRVDRSNAGVEAAERLSLSDRVGLGASDSNAVLLGLGVSYPTGALDLLGEWSWDLLVGESAPDASASPMRIEVGGRYFLDPGMHVEALLGVSPSARPAVAVDQPLYPIEPRLFVSLGLGLSFPEPPRPPPRVVEKPPRRGPSRTTLSGVVRDAEGNGIAAARVGAGEAVATTDDTGAFVLPDLPGERATITIEAEGHPPEQRVVDLSTGEFLEIEIALAPALPAGQIRGTVRSLSGEPIRASIRVEPLGVEVTTDAHGAFAVDVAPGSYTVSISAPGYDSQERPALVENNGVTVILVDLGGTD